MRRCLTILLFAILAIVLSGCASVTPTSFAEMDKSDDFEKVIVETDEACTFEVDIENFNENAAVYEGENGEILLTGIEETSSNVIELQFKAEGVTNADRATILTACAYKDDGFVQSPVTIETSENVIVKYSLMTTEIEEFGNRFALTILFEDCDVKESGTIKVTIQDLLLIEFNKG